MCFLMFEAELGGILDRIRFATSDAIDIVGQSLQSALPPRDEVLLFLMQQWLAGASCALSLLLVLTTIAAGWLALWHTTLKDIGLFREIMGLNRPKPHVRAQRQAEVKAEIEKIKRQHSRSHSRSSSLRRGGSHQEQSAEQLTGQ